MNSDRATSGAWRFVFRTELLSLVRDRRALFAGLVLPALLYPLMFLGQGWLEEVANETLEAQVVHVALDLSEAPASMAERLEELLGQQVPIELDHLPPDSFHEIDAALQEGTLEAQQREREAVEEILGTEGHLLLYALPDPEVPGRTLFRLHFDGADETSQEAQGRVDDAIDELSEELEGALYVQHFGADPARRWISESVDMARDEDLGGLWIGRILPLIAVLVLLSGGSYAALSAFSGERESGTLETLLVQPIPSLSIVWGKFAAVLVTGLATLGLNTASLFACVALGLGNLPGSDAGSAGPGSLRILGAGLLFLPVCLLLSAVLCLVCGKARSFREGQHYVMPLSLLAMLPAALAMSQEIELDPFLACIPLAGPSLAFRQAMVGGLTLGPALLAISTTLIYAWLALRKIGNLLDGEKVLASQSNSAEQALRRVQSRSALNWGWAGVLGVYLVGGLFQSWSPLWGLVATLWLLLPVGAYFCARGTASRAGESLRVSLGLRVPNPLHLIAALLAAPALARLASVWITWQQEVLPLPSSMTQAGGLPEEIMSLSAPALFLALALSPGLCEELFFRGAVLSGLKRDLPAWKSIAWQALLFGAVHASIYRFAPTAFLGALLAAITLRSRSLFPAILLHTSYNGILVLSGMAAPGSENPFAWTEAPWVPWLILPALLLWVLVKPPRQTSENQALS